jgi:hypothetical protein
MLWRALKTELRWSILSYCYIQYKFSVKQRMFIKARPGTTSFDGHGARNFDKIFAQ